MRRGFFIFSLRATAEAVPGMSCIRPTAPAGDRALIWKRDSWRMMECSSSGSSPDRLRSQSPTMSGARGYWIRSISSTVAGSLKTFDVSLMAPLRSPERYLMSPAVPPSASPIA
ncbi:MAG: hypothetical protein HW408_1327, partial [Actinobacteria bacterium]|nr:hypothetical protein [Actinomycetota bacterium]